MAGEHYGAFIEEAFIQPIRSVLIVDDDYPTYDEILNEILKRGASSGTAEDACEKKAWHDRPERVANLIRTFRQRQPPLLVDIHDGTVDDKGTPATHLHQCDLLVLDYELDRSKPGDGIRAIQILRRLMSNHHFNLVIIYTSENLETVYDAVRWGLVAPSTDVLSDGKTQEARKLIELGEDESENFERDLSKNIGAAQYFHSRMNQKSYLRTMAKKQQPYTIFSDRADDVGWSKDQQKLVLRYLLKKLESENGIENASADRFDNLEWSLRGRSWIKSDSAFVAFSQKADDDDLLSDLQEALVHWSPRPSRLFLTKLRAEIDEYGVAAQGPALRSHHAFAYWYHRLLTSSDKEDRRWQIAESVSRHSDQLMRTVLPNVEKFASRLIAAEVDTGEPTTICKDHFGVDLNNNNDTDEIRAVLEHNAFVCSMEPAGWHLTTGHVFSMADELWLCLSPACDMVPSQIPGWRIDTFGERLQFVGIKLYSLREKKALDDVYSNRFVFLRIDGEVKSYCFNDPSGEESAPYWQVLFTENRGRFLEQSFRFTVSYIKQGKSKRLISKRLQAEVIGQLRYEYALNLIQKLGVSLTRVGLDFSNMKGPGA